MTTAAAVEAMRSSSGLGDERAVETFLAGLRVVEAHPDPAQLPSLHLILDDATANTEVMFSLVHLLETYTPDAQIAAMLSVLPELQERAGWWTKALHYRILNSDEARAVYMRLLSDAQSETRGIACSILGKIEAEGRPGVSDRARLVRASACVREA